MPIEQPLAKKNVKSEVFTLKWTNSKLINFNAVKSIVCRSDMKEITVTNPCKISRIARKRKLYNRFESNNTKWCKRRDVFLIIKTQFLMVSKWK